MHLAVSGLIPARAGKTLGCVGRWVASWAHPRAGGENRVDSLTDGVLSGSSPRGRGKHGRRQRCR